MIWLSDVAQSRDNNFNIIRALAAVAVLVSHAFPIALGPGTPEPLEHLTGFSLGSISVQAFFVISGFLIAQSYVRSKTRRRFVLARFLRLWPGLIVSIALVALVLGPLVTSLSAGTYFSDSGTWAFLVRNITLLSVQYHLPGVFEELPYTAIEGSIWTLLYEVLCYVGLFVLGVLGLFTRIRLMALVFVGFLALYFAVQILDPALHPKLLRLILLALPFGVGTAFYVWRDYIPLTVWGIAGLAVLTWLTHGSVVYPPLFALTLGYGVFWAAYIPGGQILRAYNHLGDYSYGIYIYAFPLQGLAVWLWGPMTPLENILLSLPLVLVPSVLSWHFVEKPALGLLKKPSAAVPAQATAS